MSTVTSAAPASGESGSLVSATSVAEDASANATASALRPDCEAATRSASPPSSAGASLSSSAVSISHAGTPDATSVIQAGRSAASDAPIPVRITRSWRPSAATGATSNGARAANPARARG